MKKQSKKLAIFEGQKIRRIWDDKKESWYFSVVDIVAVLTNQSEHKKAQSYWTTLKNRLKEEGSEVVTKCDQLKMQATARIIKNFQGKLFFILSAILATSSLGKDFPGQCL